MTSPAPAPARISLVPLQEQLAAAGYDVSNGIGSNDMRTNVIYTYDANAAPLALPAAAQPLIDQYLDEARSAAEEDPLDLIRNVQLGTSSDRLRDAIVAYLEKTR